MSEQPQLTFGLAKPGKGLVIAMVTLVAVWLFFAVGINFGQAGEQVFGALVGSNAILHGEVWRVFTAPLLHLPSGAGSVGHLLFNVMGLYFLGTTLEERWGYRRFLAFIYGSAVFAAIAQAVIAGLIPVPALQQPTFFGALAMVDAVCVAWALSFKNSQVRLFFVLPVSGTGLLLFTLFINLMYIVGSDAHHDGLITPLAGMLAGYLFGDTSPARRWYLQRRFKNLQQESAVLRGVRLAGSAPRLKVIEGGLTGRSHDEKSRDDKPRSPTDKRYLN